MNPDVQELKTWFEHSVKPFLQEYMPSKTADLEAALVRIEAQARRAEEDLAICFLGDSGVGKSTLINALVAGNEMVLPSGGIGPLTALAMEVRYGVEPSLEAEYHPANKLWQGVIFGLERGYEAQLKEATGHGVDVAEPTELLGDEAAEEIEAEPLEEAGNSRLETFRKQAQLLVKGNQDLTAGLPYLLDCLREAAGSRRFWGTTLLGEDEARMKRLAHALAMGKAGRTHQCSKITSPNAFESDLRDHASGFLAPLIKALRVKWPSPLLQNGIVLVDLPGVGVAGDVYREVTQSWVSKRAKAVVLVVGRSGLTEPAVDLLRTSNFLERLLFYRDARADDPVVLGVAMSHVDSVAEDEWYRDKSKKKAVHLQEQFQRASPVIQSQLRQMLARVWESGDSNVRGGQEEVIENLASNAMVFPVSAPEYRKFLVQDDDDRPFISTADQSGIPQMRDGLVATVQSRREEARRGRDESITAFVSQVAAWSELVRAQSVGGGRTLVEVQQFEADLQAMIAPLRKEFLVRQGGFRAFLKGTMPAHIG